MTDKQPDKSHPMAQERPQHWLDQAISKARDEGAFDNLPNTGKPLNLDNVSTDSEYDLAFTMLRNAGMSPYWMEIGKEAEAIEAKMADLRRRTCAYLDDQLRRLDSRPQTEEATVLDSPRGSRFWPFGRRRQGESREETSQRVDRPALERARTNAREQHRELARELDQKLQAYHQALPSELWHLQRFRRAEEEWAAQFDAACPSVYSDAWNRPEKALDESPAPM